MCLAIYSPGDEVPLEHLIEGMNNNPHGAGIAWSDGFEVRISKGMWDIRRLAEELASVDGYPHLIHFRYATHGRVNARNCHPFRVGDHAMIHNGVLDWRSTAKSSDTACFANDFLAHNVDSIFENDDLFRAVEGVIGYRNKMAILNPWGDVRILNESAGIWDGPIWYSNSGYLPTDTKWRRWLPKERCETDSY